MHAYTHVNMYMQNHQTSLLTYPGNSELLSPDPTWASASQCRQAKLQPFAGEICGFPFMGVPPNRSFFFQENIPLKWMIFGDSPILGKPFFWRSKGLRIIDPWPNLMGQCCQTLITITAQSSFVGLQDQSSNQTWQWKMTHLSKIFP